MTANNEGKTMVHSPAPWIVTENGDGDVLVRMDKAHSVVVANLEGSCQTCHANADLIAAVPELLEVVEIALQWLDMDHPGGSYAANRIKEVIAKVKGKYPAQEEDHPDNHGYPSVADHINKLNAKVD